MEPKNAPLLQECFKKLYDEVVMVQTHEDSTKNCEVTDKKDSAIKNPEKSNSVEALAEADQQIHLVKSEKNNGESVLKSKNDYNTSAYKT